MLPPLDVESCSELTYYFYNFFGCRLLYRVVQKVRTGFNFASNLCLMHFISFEKPLKAHSSDDVEALK